MSLSLFYISFNLMYTRNYKYYSAIVLYLGQRKQIE